MLAKIIQTLRGLVGPILGLLGVLTAVFTIVLAALTPDNPLAAAGILLGGFAIAALLGGFAVLVANSERVSEDVRRTAANAASLSRTEQALLEALTQSEES